MSLESSTQLSPLQFKGEIMDFDLGLDIDHRKRRRNRTTQSCLNCHTSKRKCDRKRPCQRCIQLGLTGLCVYEVDDPALRDDPNIDETTRLRNRIAELESLVRELRGKPHPRWAEPNYCDGDANEKWHSRSTKRPQSQYQKGRRDGLLETSAAVKSEQSIDLSRPQLYHIASAPSTFPSEAQLISETYYRDNAHNHTHSVPSSPPSDSTAYYSSSSSNSPLGYGTARHLENTVQSNGDSYSQHSYTRPTYDASTMQTSCPCFSNPAVTHIYVALLNQLHSASQQLRQLPEHHSQHDCAVLGRILELDDLMHVTHSGYTAENAYEALPTPTDSEVMSPTSTSSHSSLGTSIQTWPAIANPSEYDAYYSVSAGEQGVYQKPYHIT
ncbi:hypothetical protein WOLCODRAFT_116217 [Wolfiporia cocos MD-104 SS10]|uniref:Zn(2)-C6 fungal-type domain-containing protein n=1 Tax=Wolfiporia cocos (strain MD-104) TaxID=742152 RepID=A0A2H3JPZ4_WOLCO|nr:hypothetical protein WOLCODRAFT_116217 [Wolfiporia cocos MD-104 SS10]